MKKLSSIKLNPNAKNIRDHYIRIYLPDLANVLDIQWIFIMHVSLKKF